MKRIYFLFLSLSAITIAIVNKMCLYITITYGYWDIMV